MKTFKLLFSIAACALAASAHATVQPPLVLTQGFEDISALDGWERVNRSDPPGISWFQGDAGIFSAQAGADDSYIAANFLSAQHGNGAVDNWLILPEMALAGTIELSFYTRSAGGLPFNDMLEVRFGAGGSADTTAFPRTLLTIGGSTPYPETWQRNTATVNRNGRFAFRYVGAGFMSNYIGIDSVNIITVPEPASWAMLGVGLGLLAFLRRRLPRGPGVLLALAASCLPPVASGAQQEGMVVVRDPESGQLRAPTAAEFKALQAAAPEPRPNGVAPVAPQLSRQADGTLRAHLGDRAMVHTVVRRDTDGTVRTRCAAGAAAEAAVSSAIVPQHVEEQRHDHH